MDFHFKCVEERKDGDNEPMVCEEDNNSMHDRENFAVVTLQDTDEVVVVASDWLSTDQKQCYWPPFKSIEKNVEAVKNKLEPSTGGKPWEKLNVICHAEYDTYEEAVNKQVDQRAQKDGLTMYAVVTQQDSDVVMVAASNWLSEDKKQCYWPPFKSPEKCMEAVQNRIKPETGGKPWEKLNISFYREYDTFDKAEEGQKEIKEQKERSFLLATGFSGIKRQRLESTQGMSKHPPVTLASTSRMSADADKDELFQMLRDIKSVVQGNSVMLKKLLKDKDSKIPKKTSIPSKDGETKINLPLRTFKDVARTERELSNPTTRQKYVKYLSMFGGVQPKFVIKNIMQQVLSDDLAMQFNRRGRGDKKPFSELILTDVIRDAASKQSIMRDECETEIKNYLSCIADRIGRKRPIE